MNSSMKSSTKGSQNEMNSSDPVFFTHIATKPRAKTILTTLDTQKVVSTTSEDSKIDKNTLKSEIDGKMSKNVSSDDKMREKASQNKRNTRNNSSESPKNQEKSPEIAPPPIKLLEVSYGTVEINWHKKFQRIAFERIKYQRSAHMPYRLDPRRVKQLWRECAEEVLTNSPVAINNNDNDVFISKIILQKIKEDKLSSQDKSTLDQDNCPKSPKILVDNGNNICTVDASTSDSVGEDVVSSTECDETGERCSPGEGIAEGEIDSSSSTPSNCSEDLPDSSLDPKTVKNSLEIPELLDSLDSKIVKNILEIPGFLDLLELKTAKNIAEIPELSNLLEPKTVENIVEIPELSDSLEPKSAKKIAEIPELPNLLELKSAKKIEKIPELPDSLEAKSTKNIEEIPELPDSLDPKTAKNIAEIPELSDSLEAKSAKNIAEIPELSDSLEPKTAKKIEEIPELSDSLDPKTVESIPEIPELLDENRGSPHSRFVMRKDIKFNSSKGRQIKEPQEILDKGVNSEETSAKSSEDIVMGLNSSVEGMENSPVQKEKPKAVTSNPPQSSSNDNPVVESSISASPISSHDKSSKIKVVEMSAVSNKTKSSEKEEKSSSLEKIKKRKEQSSDSSNVKSNEVPKSGKSSSKDRSSEPDAKKKKKSTPEEDLKESMKKKESSNIEKSHKDKESHKKSHSSSSSLTASKKRESSGSRSNSQEPHKKKHRTSESSSHSSQTPEKISSKVKPKDASLERIKTEEPSTPSAVNDSKEDAKKKPTPVGSSKKGKRVSRLSLDGDAGTSATSVTFVTEKIKETLDRIKVKDKPATESKKPANSANESSLHRKTIRELLGLPKECAEKKVERPPQKDKIEEKPEKKSAEESKKENHDHPKNEKNAESMGKEAPKQKPLEKSSAPSGTHVPGDYLGRRLLKIARDEREKEKKILADVPKPASAVQRKKRVSIPQVKTPAVPAADILAINASVPIDVHLFENIDKEPLPPAPPVIPNKVFPHVLPDNPSEKTDKIPLICETSIPLNNLVDMDIDSLDQEDYDETCSLNSVETVILEMSPKEPELEKPPVKEDHKEPNELLSLEEKISHMEREELEFERIIKELGLIETPQIKEDTAVDQKPVNNNLVKLAAKDPQNLELKLHNQVVIPAEPQRIEKKPQIQVPVKSQSIMPFILMQVMLPEPSNQLQNEEKEITMLYEDVIHLIQVTKHHRTKVETMSVLEFQTHVNGLCNTFKKFFDNLKNKENVITDEEMIQLIVEHSSHLSSPWHVTATDISWLLRNSPMKPLAPVPPPISKMNEKLNVRNKNIINNQLAAEQRHQQQQHQQRHQLHVPKNEGPPTNAAANPSVNLHLPNNRGPHSERVVPNQGLYSTNGHRPILPRSMPNFNYQGPDQKREFPSSQNEMLRMNANMQQQQQQRPPLPDQPFPRAPPPPPPPPPQQQPGPQQNCYQQLNYNNQYQQFPQNEQMVPQQMPNISPCAPNYQQYGPYVGPLYCNQYQYIPGQPAPNMCNIQQFPSQQHIPAPLNQGSYSVPPLSMETVQRVNAIIPPELHLCYSGRCDHENCEKYLKFQEFLRQMRLDPTRSGQIPPQTVPSQFAGPQAQSNRDPRSRGAQGSQMQMQSQVLQQHVAARQVLQLRVSQSSTSHISHRQVLQTHVGQPQVSQSQVPSMRISQPHVSQRQVPQPYVTPPQVPQSQVPLMRISQRQVLQQNVTPPQVPQSQVPSMRISQPNVPQRQVLQQSVTPPQVPQTQVPLKRISQPHISQQRQVLQQNVISPQIPQSQVLPSNILQSHLSQRQVLQQNVTPPQIPQSQVPSPRISQPHIPQPHISQQRQVLQQNVTPPQVSQPQIPRQSPMQQSPPNDAMMTTPRIQSNLAALQQMNQSIRPPPNLSQHFQNQGPLLKCPGRPNLQYPPRLSVPHPAFFPLGNQTSNPPRRESLDNPLNRKSPQTIAHPPKIPTPTEIRPKPIRSPVEKLKEILPGLTSPIPIAVLTPKSSPKPSPSPSNTPKPPRNCSPLNLSNDRNLKQSLEPPKLHLNVKDENTERLIKISPKEIRQKRTIDVITVSSSEDEEESEPEPKRLNKTPEFSRVDDEIECVGIAKELGIKLDTASSSELVNSEDSANFPVIGAVMTIPMTDFERMNIIMEKEEDEMDFKDEVPMEIQEESPIEESEEEVLCITCNEKAAVACCRKCDRELFCSEACAEKSAHFASCILVVKIEDD